MLRLMIVILSLSLTTAFSQSTPDTGANMENIFLLDDFSSDISRRATSWEGFTDRVMGGRSDMEISVRREAGVSFLKMTGKVSLDNNGGFIQARLRLNPDSSPWDVSEYQGIQLTVRGKGDSYYLFLRTSQTRFPWKFYMAPIPLSEEWQQIRIPWSEFSKGDFGMMPGLNTKKLKSLAVVAYKKNFLAEIEVADISLYK